MNAALFDIQAEFCKAMGNPVRLKILHALREGPKSVSDLCQETGLPQGTISRQLAVLRNVGVVMKNKNDKGSAYQVADRKIIEVCDLVQSVLIENSRQHALWFQ